MKKIPTLFVREFKDHEVVNTTSEVTKGFEWVLNGEGVATVKWDGACCAIIDGELYKRYDAKKGKKAPEGAIPCCEPDPITGHHPHWLKCDRNKPEDKWFWKAYDYTIEHYGNQPDGTYEAVGKHFNGNPYDFIDGDYMIPHGKAIIPEKDLFRCYGGIKKYLTEHYIEGIVFWKDGEPQCKIKRKDFGLDWNNKEKDIDRLDDESYYIYYINEDWDDIK